MNRCLTIKLGATVNNSNLRKSGELRIDVHRLGNPTNRTQRIAMRSETAVYAEILGDGYFTDSTLTQNVGRRRLLPANTIVTMYCSNGDYQISVEKTNLVAISLSAITSEDTETRTCFGLDVTELSNCEKLKNFYWSDSYLYGDLSYVKNTPAIEHFEVRNTDVYGDIEFLRSCSNLITVLLAGLTLVKGDLSVFANKAALTALRISSTSISGDIASLVNDVNITTLSLHNTEVYGDIAALSNMSSMTGSVNLYNTRVYGNIAAFADMEAMIVLNITGTDISGSLESISHLPNLTGLFINHCPLTMGNLVNLPPKLYYIYCPSTPYLTATWVGSRASGTPIISMETIDLGDYVDAALNELAQHDASSSDSHKIIKLIGNRTALSDDAVAILANKGFTVIVRAPTT